MSAPHWTVTAMADVVVRRQSVLWLRAVASAVPEAYVPAFTEQLEAVVHELLVRGEPALATGVFDVLVTLPVTR